jgi:hypothetical protein
LTKTEIYINVPGITKASRALMSDELKPTSERARKRASGKIRREH